MEKQSFDVVVIGSGPGGYVAAIRAVRQGLRTALVETGELGGTCLNRGCIPSKALIANADVLRKVRSADKYGISVGEISFDYKKMKERKDKTVDGIRRGLTGLIASNKISVFRGFGKLEDAHTVKVCGEDEAFLSAENIILATGSEPRALSQFQVDGKKVHDSTSLLNLESLPKSLLIIGGGVIGCEFACLHNAFDVDVTILELLPRILPLEGQNISDVLTASFKKKGITVETSMVIDTLDTSGAGVMAHLADGRIFEADMALVCVGRSLNTSDIGLEKAGVHLKPNGAIPTNDQMQTNVSNIYAIGDITGKWALAHVASHQGIVAVDTIAGKEVHLNENAVPSVIFTTPEIATIGMTLEEAHKAGYDAHFGKFPFQALGKSQATIETEGFAQIVTEKSTGQILGAQVVGYGAATMIAEMAVAISAELTVETITETIHAHPTIAEAWLEAALMADEMPLHMPPR